MTPTVESWIGAWHENGCTSYSALIRADDVGYSIHSGAGPLDRAVQVAHGDVRVFLDAEVARALGQQLIAAADHYATQAGSAS